MAATQQQIELKAYEIWEREGRPGGRDHEHWLKAVEELSVTAKPKKTSAKSAVAAPSVAETVKPKKAEKPAKAEGPKAAVAKLVKAVAGKSKPKAEQVDAPAKPKRKAAKATI